MSAANQAKVSHAPLLLRHSFHVITLVISMMPRPSRAAATEFTPIWPPKIQSATVTSRAPAVSFSSTERGPNFSNSSLHPRGILFLWCAGRGKDDARTMKIRFEEILTSDALLRGEDSSIVKGGGNQL